MADIIPHTKRARCNSCHIPESTSSELQIRRRISRNFPDHINKDEETKFKAVVSEIEQLNQEGRPVLIGTVSIENSEDLSKRLTKLGIRHHVLNAKEHTKEGDIIKEAGESGAVTVATNMAGRGVDIILGGRPPKKPIILYHSFRYQAASWEIARRVVAKIEWHAGELFPRIGFIVTNLRWKSSNVVRFYNKRGTAEQWIKEGKYAAFLVFNPT